LKASYFEIIDTIQSELSHWFRSLIFLSSNLCLFFHQYRIAFLTRKSYNPSLVNSTTKNISEDLSAETTTVKSIVSSKLPDVFLNEYTRLNLDQFLKWFCKYKAAFTTIYLLLSVGLTVGVSTATCEASFSSVVRILTPYCRCTTHDRTGRHPGQEANLAPPCSNLRSLGSKCTALRKVHVTLDFLAPSQSFGAPHSDSTPGELYPPCPPSLRPCDRINVSWFCQVLKKMKQLLWQTNTSFLNFRPKLDDCNV